jgi:putative flippase GtrA
MGLKSKLFWQLVRFVVIGASAALVNFAIVVALVESHLLQPLSANVVAFIIAFQISYWGHRHWTFAATNQHKIAVPRLLIVSISNFFINQSLFYILLYQYHLHYMIALLIVLATLPLITFTINKFWVFK